MGIAVREYQPDVGPANYVLFVDASEIGTRNKNSVAISKEDALLIAELAAGKLVEDERYKSVFIPEIRLHNNELSISRYIIKK